MGERELNYSHVHFSILPTIHLSVYPSNQPIIHQAVGLDLRPVSHSGNVLSVLDIFRAVELTLTTQPAHCTQDNKVNLLDGN